MYAGMVPIIDVVFTVNYPKDPHYLPTIQEKTHRYPICLQKLQKTEIFISEPLRMSKYEIIDCIMNINKTASQEFLDQFTVEDLDLYLEHLMQVDLEEIALCA
jgi:hypothetical protein